jgi:hypothetical protein
MKRKNEVKKKKSYLFPEEKAFLDRKAQERKEQVYTGAYSDLDSKNVRSTKVNIDYLKRKAKQQVGVFLKEDKTKQVKQPKLLIGQNLSREQDMMQEMFNGDRTWGTGENLPQLNNTLTSGYGLINNDDYGETASMFGVKRR